MEPPIHESTIRIGQGATAERTEAGADGRASERERLTRLDAAIARAVERLLALQRPDGHWCGELEADTVLESEYVLLWHFLGRGDQPKARRAAAYVRDRQGPEGGWAIYEGGPPEVSATVKAYFALKLVGDEPAAPHMRRARRAARRLGGVEATNTYTKIYLALFGQYPWERCPAIPPEMVLLPRWCYFHLGAMSSWSRGIFVPLSILWALKPVRDVPPGRGLEELWVPAAGDAADMAAPDPVSPTGLRRRAWDAFFRVADRVLKWIERRGWTPARRRALERAQGWVAERLEESDGLGAIFPAIVNTALAFHALGHGLEHPVIRRSLAALRKHEVELGPVLRIQPALSPVWDTAQAMVALRHAGLPADHPALIRAARWLLDREVERPGDWKANAPDVPLGGWYFEYANEFYPDTDDTAEVLTALSTVRPADDETAERVRAARERGLAWLLSMQNRDGGWGAFDRDCDRRPLTLVPFADHNAMIDPSWEDITGRVLETLADAGLDSEEPAVRRAVAFLRDRQEPDGTWFGRWGCNYLYGTWLALWGLARAGEDMGAPRYERAAAWLRAHQNADGGWGESLATYEDPGLKGRGESTAAQTSWALLGLLAAGDRSSRAVRRGVGHLLSTQRHDGGWRDDPWTGTGFPGVFYLRYDLYDDYFPLRALAVYRRLAAPEDDVTSAGASRPPHELLEHGTRR